MNNQLDVVDVQPIERYGVPSENMVSRLSSILKAGYSKPKRRQNETQVQFEDRTILDHEFSVVVQKAFARGYNPLSNGFHFFKMNGSIDVIDHWATLNSWAQGKDKFTYEFFKVTGKELEQVPEATEKDFVVKCVIVRRSDRSDYEKRYNEVFDRALEYFSDWEKAEEKAQRATERLSFIGYGVVQYNEVYYENSGKPIYGATPRGWVPGWTRAETRAFRNAVKRSHGIPSPAEIYQMSFGALQVKDYERLLPSVPYGEEQHASRYIQLEAEYENGRKEREAMTLEERRERFEERNKMLHGDPDEAGIGDEEEQVAAQGELDRQEETEPEENTILVPSDDELKSVTVGEMRTRFSELGVPDNRHLEFINAVLDRNYTTPPQLSVLNNVEFWNLCQYRMRRMVLDNTDNGSPAERLELIPEIVEAAPEGRPTTLKDAKAFLKGLVKDMSANNEYLKDLSLERVDAQ